MKLLFSQPGETVIRVATGDKKQKSPGRQTTGVLQHASPEPGEQHYNLSRSMQAGRRFAAHLAEARNRLRSLKNQG